MKDDGSFIISEGKPLRRGGSSGYVPHEVCLQLDFRCLIEVSGFDVWSFTNLIA